jgi:hypothetical protein
VEDGVGRHLTESSTVKDAKASGTVGPRNASPVLAVTAVTVLLACSFFFLIWKYSINVLWWDEWEYLGAFFRGNPGIVELFTWQHGPHREGLGLIPDKFLYPLTHWNVRVDAFLIGICILVSMVLALLLKRRLFGPISYSDIAIPFLFLTLNQYETLIGTPNLAYAGFPLLMIMLYCHALLQTNQLLRYAFLLLLNFLLIYTGFGLFMGPVTLGVLAIECYRSSRRLTGVPPALPLSALIIAAASLGSFFIHYKFWPAVDCFGTSHHSFWSYAWFVVILFSRFIIGARGAVLATAVGLPIASVAICLAAFHLQRLLKGRPSADPHGISLVLLGYSLLFAVNCAIGRVCIGLPVAAQASRYATLMIPAFLAFYFWLISLPKGSWRSAALIIFLISLVPGSLYTSGSVKWYAGVKTIWSECYLQNEDIQYCDQVAGFQIYPSSGPARPALQQKLDYLKQHHLSFFADEEKKDQR